MNRGLVLFQFVKIRATHAFVGVDVCPFSFWAEKVKITEGDKIMVEILCLEEVSIFNQIGFVFVLPE